MANQPTNQSSQNQQDDPNNQQRPTFDWRFTLWYFLLAFIALQIAQWSLVSQRTDQIPYSQFRQALENGRILEVTLEENWIEGRWNPPQDQANGGEDRTENNQAGQERPNAATGTAQNQTSADEQPGEPFRAIRVQDDSLIPTLEEQGITYRGSLPNRLAEIFWQWIIPIGILVLIWLFLMNRMAQQGGGGGGIFSFGKAKPKIYHEQKTGVSFHDVAGCEAAKEELHETIEFLRNPHRFIDLGAKIPKGILLVGPPGTGKTLLARAVAGEADVPFFFISGSDFVEMFVGVGASKVRDLFKQANENAPCIMFIDEIDAVGRKRGAGMGGGHDEREQTLNQLLSEMDGFEPNKGIIMMAATNRADVLDPALLRAGRFDRRVVVDAASAPGREAILRVHARGKPLAEDVDFSIIARRTPGFSGADLANVMNEAALLAGRRQKQEINMRDIEESIDRVIAGPQRKSRILSDKERKIVAHHESGHALVAAMCENTDPVHKINIVPRGQAALGYTMQLPLEEKFLVDQEELLDRIAVLLGGRAAENKVFGHISTGAQNDLQQATQIARSMICDYGMSDELGNVALGSQQGEVFLPVQMAQGRDYSEATAQKIDMQIREIIETQYQRAQELIDQHQERLKELADTLLDREVLERDEIVSILQPKEKQNNKLEA